MRTILIGTLSAVIFVPFVPARASSQDTFVGVVVSPTIATDLNSFGLRIFTGRVEAAINTSPRFWISGGTFSHDNECTDAVCDGGWEVGAGASHDFAGHRNERRLHPYIGAGAIYRTTDHDRDIFPLVHAGIDVLVSPSFGWRFETQATSYPDWAGKPIINIGVGMRFAF